MKSTPSNIPVRVLKAKIMLALQELYHKDKYLLNEDVNERSVSYRLAMYLQNEFKDWAVDCEYNRNVLETDLIKRLSSPHLIGETATTTDLRATTVYPDIIIHHRGTDNNLIVIEIKKHPSSTYLDNKDRVKLKGYRDELHYKYGLFLKLYRDYRTTLKYLQTNLVINNDKHL